VIGVTGSLGPQFFAGAWDSSQPAGSKCLTLRGVAGNKVEQIHFGSPCLTFDAINADAGGAQFGASDGAVFENGGASFTYLGGSIGNVVDQKGALVDGPGIVFDGTRFHDVVIRTDGVHSECIFAEVPEGMVIRNASFSNCAVMDLFFVWPAWWSPQPAAYGHVTLDHNSFGAPVPPNGSVYVGGTGPNSDTQARGWRITNNAFGSPGVWGNMVSSITCGNTGSVNASWQVPC
jgi:hypothetical protein